MVTLKLRRPKARKMAEPQPAAPAKNPLESFLDVLNRDQRTIVTINRRSEAIEKRSGDSRSFLRENYSVSKSRPLTKNHVDSLKISESVSTIDRLIKKIQSRSWGSRRRFDSLINRLGQVFIVGVCLLTIVRVPSAMAAPSKHPDQTNLSYLDTCGSVREEDVKYTTHPPTSRLSDYDIVTHIILRAENARVYAEGFRDRYVDKTFHMNFNTFHPQFNDRGYVWLPLIPKKLGKKVEHKHLKDKNLDDFLIKSFEYLQRFAVGFEQIVNDQKKYQGEFYENFRMTEVHLRNVICEIREGLLERNIIPRDQMRRSIMNDDVRDMSSDSFRNLRDWLIYRDLMNCLEYIIEVFNYIQEKRVFSS